MNLPLSDWQFWVATLAAVFAAGYLLRNLLPVPFLSRRAKARRSERKATLTISAKKS